MGRVAWEGLHGKGYMGRVAWEGLHGVLHGSAGHSTGEHSRRPAHTSVPPSSTLPYSPAVHPLRVVAIDGQSTSSSFAPPAASPAPPSAPLASSSQPLTPPPPLQTQASSPSGRVRSVCLSM